MTTLNTIIEEEKKKLEDTAGYNYNLYLAGTVRRADTGEDWTFEQAEKELKDFLTTAMQRAYEAGRGERDTYWKEREKARDEAPLAELESEVKELNRKEEWRMFKIADELAKLQGWLGTVAGSEVDSTLIAKAPSKEVRDSKALHTSIIMTAKKKIKEIQTLTNEDNLK